jgi:hypothetical protein
MPELQCTARRIGDLESRTEEYEVSFKLDGAEPGAVLDIRYQAARAYEINAALDDAVTAARAAIGAESPDLAGAPTHEALAKFTWRTIQSVKYEDGAAKTTRLEL